MQIEILLETMRKKFKAKYNIKGIVQWKLTGVESGINEKVCC
jgi:hypothetical protein